MSKRDRFPVLAEPENFPTRRRPLWSLLSRVPYFSEALYVLTYMAILYIGL